MRTVLLASLRRHLRRYVAAGTAVVVAVAFVVAVGVLTTGTQTRITAGAGAPFAGADYVVTNLGTQNAITYAAQHGDEVAVLGSATLPLRAGDEQAAGKFVGSVADLPRLRWQTLDTGRFPEREGEAVVDAWTAQEMTIAVGDTVTLGAGGDAVDLRVVGIGAASASLGQASVYITFDQLLHWRDDDTLLLDRAVVVGDPGRLPDGAVALTPQEHVAAEMAQHTGNVNTMALLLLVFAGIAVLVSVLVITNTFAILFAQRVRDFALLRCVGATRRQVVGSVRREAVVVGVLASLGGAGAGIALGYGLIALAGALTRNSPLGFPDGLPVRWLLGGFAVGVVVTLLASWLPTRRVVRVSPLAALRPDGVVDARTGAGRVRVVLGAVLLAGGAALLTVAAVRNSAVSMVAGGAALFAGVLLFGPLLVPRVVRGIGALLGPGGRLATENAVRNPRRTATTTASLLVGVTLTTAVLTGLATTRASVDANHGSAHPLDVALTSWDGPLDADVLEQVRATPGVGQAITVEGVLVEVDRGSGGGGGSAGAEDGSGGGAGSDGSGADGGGTSDVDADQPPLLLLSAPDAGLVARDGGTFAAVGAGTVALDADVYGDDPGDSLGDPVTVRVADGGADGSTAAGGGAAGADDAAGDGEHDVAVAVPEVELQVTAGRGWGGAGLVASGTLATLGTPRPHAVWVRAAADADPVALVGALETLAGTVGADVDNGLRAEVADDQMLGIITGATLGLLGVSVVIALVGIANTLGLSVLERAREHAVLRALGLTRRQLRRMLATEAVLLSVTAALLGTVLGVGFAWVGYETFVKAALDAATWRIPWLELAAVLPVGVVAGLLAAVLPARRAAGVTPAAALTLD
ncbi:FtsX-like permease family protein [Promicromonospora sukumoe]|uniref:FtsX-like permease family protein n=1 Tax=Promicromonospora sukumoe TaxID=88382 RepID=UPI0003666298|nr:ABC transporter permease [Promicromonospora sukumoe]